MHTAHRDVVQDHRAAERAVDTVQRSPGYVVFHHFVPGKDAFRVGADISIDRHAEDDIVAGQVTRIPRGDHLRVLERRNAVAPDSAPAYLVEADRSLRPAGEVLAEAGIDLLVQRRLELRVIRVVARVRGP